MKFRSPTDEPVHLALLSGHSAIVYREWRELPEIFHDEALARRCECDKRVTAPKGARVLNSAEAINQSPDVDTLYRQALTTMLERDVEGDFNGDGQPAVKVVSELAGFAATKEDMLRVFRAMEAEAAAASADDKGGK